MRTYTVTLRPDGIKGKIRTFVVSFRAFVLGCAFAAALLLAAGWLFVQFVILPYGDVLERHTQAVRLREANEELTTAIAEQELLLDWVGARVSLELALVEKVSSLLGGEEWQGGGFPGISGDRAEGLFDAVVYLERRIEGHERFADLLEHMPIRLPVRGEFDIASGFGRRRSPFSAGIEMHNGIDLSADVGTVVLAAGSGRVSLAGRWSDLRVPEYGRLGLFVRLEHGDTGFSTIYGHCQQIFVKNGDFVKAGDKIATVGNTGWSTAPHLHFAIARGEHYYDPEDFLLYFDAGMVRRAMLARPAADIGGGSGAGEARR